MSAFTLYILAPPKTGCANSHPELAVPSGRFAQETTHAKRNRANHSFAERKALRRHRGPRSKTGQRSLFGPAPRSCIRVHSQENKLKRTKIALALPSYDRQRLSGIRRGWCPSRSKKTGLGVPFRRWRCSPPVVKCAGCISGAESSQGETARKKRPWRLWNPPFSGDRRDGWTMPPARQFSQNPIFYPGIISENPNYGPKCRTR